MHKELRYQVKTQAISDMSRKKYPANTPQFFFFFFKNAIWKKKHHMQGKIKPDDANTEKQSLDLLFLSSSKKYLQISLKRNRG
jgi:predicted nucleic acid-binding protein